jgi:DNA-binding NarL/FixJ family response regulator
MDGLNFGSILTTPEERILESKSLGLTRRQVAKVLGVTKSSVTDNIRSLKEKLEADNLKQLIKNAVSVQGA